MEKALNRGYKHYWNAIDTLPSYMEKNLKEMPNNKGYRWRNVVFYGALPPQEENSTIIFEKNPKGLLIHEYKLDGTYNQTIKPFGQKSENKNRSNYEQLKNNKQKNTNNNEHNKTTQINHNDKKNKPKRYKNNHVQSNVKTNSSIKNDTNNKKPVNIKSKRLLFNKNTQTSNIKLNNSSNK